MKKIIFFIFVIVFLSSITLAYHGTSGNYEWRFFPGEFGANASSATYDIRANAGGYPADTFNVGGYSGDFQDYDLDQLILAIQLISPPNGSSQSSTTVNFIYNLTTTNPANCSLTVDGVNIYNDTNKTSGQHTITQTLAVGAHVWNITCNSSSNDNHSETWYFTITAPTPSGAVSGGGGGGGAIIDAGPFYDINIGKLAIGEMSKIVVDSPISGELVVLYEKNGKWFYVTDLQISKGEAFFTPEIPGKYRFDLKYLGKIAGSTEAIVGLGVMTERPFGSFFSKMTDSQEQPSVGKAAVDVDLKVPAEEKPVAVVSEVKEKLDISAGVLAVAVLLVLIVLIRLLTLIKRSKKRPAKNVQKEKPKKVVEEKKLDVISTDLDRIDEELKVLKRKYKF